MSFWDFVPKILPAVIAAGATIYGANQTSKANQQATQQLVDSQRPIIDAQRQQLELQRQATEAQTAALEKARQDLAANQRAASPGLLATQEIIARGSRLTPEQEQAVADSRAETLNALRGSSLRGSARATSAVISDAEKRVRNNFMTTNQNAANSAATGLSGQYFASGNRIADNAIQGGNAISQGLLNAGNTGLNMGQTFSNIGNIRAANTMGQGSIYGQAVGDVGAVIADAVKQGIKNDRDEQSKVEKL